jgi:hypothetical protein
MTPIPLKEAYMTEEEIIQSAFEETLKVVCSTFFTSYMIASSAEGKQEADARFIAGIKRARLARVQALAILPAP